MYNYSPMYEHWVAQLNVLMADREPVFETIEGFDISLEPVIKKSYLVSVNDDDLGTINSAEGILNALASYLEEEVDEYSNSRTIAAVGRVISGLLWEYDLDSVGE
jgi:hypothetical protein